MFASSVEPLPKDFFGQRICQIFGRYRWQTIEAQAPDDATAKPNWKTVKNYPLRPRSLWLKWQDAKQLVGVRFGNVTQYAVIDIDAGSPYRSPEALRHIRAALETIGLTRTLLTRSSWNGGLHLYIPLPEDVPTFDLAIALKQCLQSQGFTLKQGQLETFPNVKSFGKYWIGQFSEYNAHRLPLQPGSGSVLLNDDFQPIGSDLQRFFWSWDTCTQAQDMPLLRQAIAVGRAHHRKRPKVQLHPVEAWRQDLEAEIGEGWTDFGQTNSLLKAIACYGVVFERLRGDDLQEYVERIALSRPGYSQFCRHQHEISFRCSVWAKAAESYYWPLGSDPKRSQPTVVTVNQQRLEDAQQRIKEAMQQLRLNRNLPAQIHARLQAIQRVISISSKTLYRHLHLWHPKHMEEGKNTDESSVSADETGELEDEGRSPEPAKSEDFYTTEKKMKGVDTERIPFKQNLIPRGSARGFSTGLQESNQQ